MWDPARPSPNVPLYVMPQGLGVAPGSGPAARPSDRDVEGEKPEPRELWDAIGAAFCGHGRELCELCSAQARRIDKVRSRVCHGRRENEVKRAEARGETFEAVYCRYDEAHKMRTQREKKFLTELHKARHKGPLKRGTMRAHEL
eukprot:1408062-Prymnesium_polylepis.1